MIEHKKSIKELGIYKSKMTISRTLKDSKRNVVKKKNGTKMCSIKTTSC